jgi:Sulfotransferase domain
MAVHIIIHCGMPKSGTTALQNVLDANHDALLERNVLYPRCGRFGERDTHHRCLFLSFSQKGKLRRFPTPQYSSQSYVRDLVHEIDVSRVKTVILSSEQLFGFDAESLTSLKEALHFAKVTIYCVLRNQMDYIESVFAQKVTGMQRYSGTPKQHLQKYLKNEGSLDYNERLRKFERVFGKNSIRICWYEDVQDDISGPLYELAGVTNREGLAAVGDDNVRRTWFFVFCLRWMRRLPLLENSRRGKRLISRLDKRLCLLGAQPILEKIFRPYSSLERGRLNRQYAQKNENISSRYELYWWREPGGRSRPSRHAVGE